jgi:hypothetical protein
LVGKGRIANLPEVWNFREVSPEAKPNNLVDYALVTPDDQPDPARALTQCARLLETDGLAACQQERLNQVWVGLREAAGLPLLPLPTVVCL